jgi:hypothetical protein
MKPAAEEIGKRYTYRRLIMQGKLRLSARAAARLIGPDCAYHLYAHQSHSSHPADPTDPTDPTDH